MILLLTGQKRVICSEFIIAESRDFNFSMFVESKLKADTIAAAFLSNTTLCVYRLTILLFDVWYFCGIDVT